jgi:hypothetical protein
MATLLGGKIVDSSGPRPLLGSPSNLGTITPNALSKSSAGIDPNANAAQVLASGMKLGETPATPTAPAASLPKSAANPAPAVAAAKVATPVSTKTIYKIGKDIYDASTNTKLSYDDFMKNYNGQAKEVAAPTTPATTPTTTTPANEFAGYDAALKSEADAKVKTDAANKVANESKIDGLLSQGYSDANAIATATGMTEDEVNNYINGNESASYKLSINKNIDKLDDAYNDYKTKVDSISNGTFALTSTEQANIDAIQEKYDQMKEDQIVANKNYEGTTQTGEIRSGRQEFMNQISGGIYKQAVDDGLKKVKKIESDAINEINNYKAAIETKNYKAASEAYNAIQKSLADKATAIKSLHDATVEEYDRQQAVIKASQDAITASLNQQKLSQDIANTTVESLTPALAGASDEVIQDLAKYYGIDANLLTSSVIKTSQDFEKDMIAKGYRTINPNDVEKMRAQGADVVTYSGRAYMKEPELKSVTNKGNIDFFKGTQKVGTSTLTGGGPAGGDSDEEKAQKAEEAAFNADLKKARADLAEDPSMWGQTYDYLANQYGFTSTEDKLKLDQLLNKDMYATK